MADRESTGSAGGGDIVFDMVAQFFQLIARLAAVHDAREGSPDAADDVPALNGVLADFYGRGSLPADSPLSRDVALSVHCAARKLVELGAERAVVEGCFDTAQRRARRAALPALHGILHSGATRVVPGAPPSDARSGSCEQGTAALLQRMDRAAGGGDAA
eukprot:gene43742-28551_t